MFLKFLWRQWYRFTLAGQFMQILSMTLIIINTGVVLGFGIYLTAALVPVGLMIAWCVGLFLDLRGKAQESLESVYLSRSPFLTKHYALTEDIHKALYPDILVDEPLESD